MDERALLHTGQNPACVSGESVGWQAHGGQTGECAEISRLALQRSILRREWRHLCCSVARHRILSVDLESLP